MIKYGTTRTVFVGKTRVYKLPYLFSWEGFLKGLLSNMQERYFYDGMKDDRMCPVIFHLPGGFLVVMPKADDITREEFSGIDVKNDFWSIPVENKMDSFGKYCGRIVAVDYG